jgi:hypothetical protein
MQIVVNGKPVATLSPAVEKRLAERHSPEVAEGAVLSAEQSTAAWARRRRLLYGVLCGVAGTIASAALIMAAWWEPRDLTLVLPVYLVLAGGLAWLLRFTYRRNLAKLRGRADAQLPRMAPAGTNIRADANGLIVGQLRNPWSDLIIEAVEITDTTFDDSSVSWVEHLDLTGDGRLIVLDTVLIGSGAEVLAKVWRELTARRRTRSWS